MDDARNKAIHAALGVHAGPPSFSKSERSAYNEHRARVMAHLGITKNEYNHLRRQAHALSDADTNYANGTRGNRNYFAHPQYLGNKITNAYTEHDHHKDTSAALKKAHEVASKHGFHLYHQSDPRGASLYASKEKLHAGNYYNGHSIH